MLVERRAEPVLSDGTTLDDLVPPEGDRRISARLLHDPEVFALELERIFDRVWVFVAHESEIAGAGDFVTREIGRDPVIVIRESDGNVAVLLNVCSHRGSRVCVADRGCTEYFQCPYHGWMYEPSGALAGILMERDAYPNGIDKGRYGLKRARTETFQGLVFATWNEEAPCLREYLGGYTYYLDLLCGDTDSGLEVTGPPQRWIVPANWKIPAENLAGDGYHILVTHRSLVDLGLVGTLAGNSPIARAQKALMAGRDYDAPRVGYLQTTDPVTGHAMTMLQIPDVGLSEDDDLRVLAQLSGTPSGTAEELRRNLPAHQIAFARRHFASTGTVFPNLSMIRAPFTTATDGLPEPSFSLRLWCPQTVDSTQVLSWVLVPRDASAEFKAQTRRASIRSFGAAGIAEQDDIEIWSRIQKAARGVQGRQRTSLYVSHKDPIPDWPAPGDNYTGSTDDAQWNFYLRWRQLMGGCSR